LRSKRPRRSRSLPPPRAAFAASLEARDSAEEERKRERERERERDEKGYPGAASRKRRHVDTSFLRRRDVDRRAGCKENSVHEDGSVVLVIDDDERLTERRHWALAVPSLADMSAMLFGRSRYVRILAAAAGMICNTRSLE